MTPGEPVIHYEVDGEPQSTTERVLTVRQILVNAKDDPTKVYLIEIVGKEQKSYQGKLDEQLHMHDGMVFVTAAIGGGVVSDREAPPCR